MFRAAARSPRVFLTAQWRHFAMLNFEVDPAILEPYLPRGLELDSWNGKHYLSLVGFMFLDARLLGIRIPFHGGFPEVNLRFNVRRPDDRGGRRGIVFIRELVPKFCVSLVARRVFNESFLTLPMQSRIERAANRSEPTTVEYEWRFAGHWNRLHVEATGQWQFPDAGSLDEFIVEHYFAYTRQRDGSCLEYHVEHPPWLIKSMARAELECDAGALYGPALGAALAGSPESVLLADGSAVAVRGAVKRRRPLEEFARIPTPQS
jgi:uncharacterized protein